MVVGRPTDGPLRRAFVRILVWKLWVGVLWFAGALLGRRRALVAIWLAALVLDYAGPCVGYWTPGLGPLAADRLGDRGAHFAERFQLFLIIALGETIVVTGAHRVPARLDAGAVAALAVAFAGRRRCGGCTSTTSPSTRSARLEHAGRPRAAGARASATCTSRSWPGIIVAAVGDELVIAHPGAALQRPELAWSSAGPALYLLGHVRVPPAHGRLAERKRLGGGRGAAAPSARRRRLPALASAILVLAVLVVLIAAEIGAGARRGARGEPSPIEQLQERTEGERSLSGARIDSAVERDDDVRAACFLALDALRAQFGDDLPYKDALDRGFSFGGRRIPFLNYQKGIYRAAAQRGGAALSVNTSHDSPYDDEETEDGFLYAYRAGSVDQPDNAALHAAHLLQTPIVYFVGVRPGRYQPVYPCFVAEDRRSERRVLLTVGHLDKLPEPICRPA